MLQRRKDIVELVNSEGTVSFARLKEAFPSVSEMTLRTDLKELDRDNLLIRVYGGAKSVDYVVGTDDFISRRTERSKDKKILIAQKAVALLQPNTSVFLDSGSTITELARHIPDRDFLLFTTGIDCARELARLSRPKVHVIGGLLNRFSMSLTGVRPQQELEGLHFDLAFLGTSCYSDDMGFSCGAEDDCALKKAAMRRSDRVAVLMDSQKIGLASTFSFASLEQVQTVVTDGCADRSFLEACARAGAEAL